MANYYYFCGEFKNRQSQHPVSKKNYERGAMRYRVFLPPAFSCTVFHETIYRIRALALFEKVCSQKNTGF